MRKRLWLSLTVSLFVQGAMGQAADSSVAIREGAVEENLHYLNVIKGRPDPPMSLANQMSRLHVGTYDFIKVTQDGNHLMAEIPLDQKRRSYFQSPIPNTSFAMRQRVSSST